MTRRGFTLVEILIVIAVVGILVGMLMPALGMLQNRQRRATTTKLLTSVGVAVDAYLDDHGRLGDSIDGADFIVAPLTFLVLRPTAARRIPYVDAPMGVLAKGPMGGQYLEATLRDATVLRDWFPDPKRGNVLRWTIRNARVAGTGPYYTEAVEIRSLAGTPAKTTDDLFYSFQRATGRWAWEPLP